MRGGKKRPLLEKPRLSPLSEKVAAACDRSKEDINTSADADLSSPEDLDQPITRAANILDSLKVVVRLVEKGASG